MEVEADPDQMTEVEKAVATKQQQRDLAHEC
jgi:hypothetical protein